MVSHTDVCAFSGSTGMRPVLLYVCRFFSLTAWSVCAYNYSYPCIHMFSLYMSACLSGSLSGTTYLPICMSI